MFIISHSKGIPVRWLPPPHGKTTEIITCAGWQFPIILMKWEKQSDKTEIWKGEYHIPVGADSDISLKDQDLNVQQIENLCLPNFPHFSLFFLPVNGTLKPSMCWTFRPVKALNYEMFIYSINSNMAMYFCWIFQWIYPCWSGTTGI